MNKLLTILAEYKLDATPLPQVTATDSKITMMLTLAFSVIGAFSLLFVVIGGLRYINSQGDAQAVARAKGTIIYSVIGLVVSISAVAIVTFLLGNL